jgi:hypothetical protein
MMRAPMRFLSLSFLLLFTVNSLIGQTGSITYKIPEKFENIQGGSSGDYIFLKGETSTSVSFYVFNLKEQSFRVYLETKSLPDKKNDVTIIGHAVDDGHIYLYFKRGNIFGQNVYCLTYLFNEGKFTAPVKIQEGNTKTDVAYLSYRNEFNILSFDKENQSLIWQKYNRDSLTTETEFTVADQKIFRYFKDDFTYIPDHSNVSYTQSSSNRKIYHDGQNLIAVIDDYKPEGALAQTAVITLDPVEKKITSRFVELPFDRGIEHNSFLFQKRLYVFGIDDIKFELKIFDATSLLPLTNFYFTKDMTVSFKRSELLESKTGLHDVSLDDKWADKWDQATIAKYTFRMLKGHPVINVSEADDNTIRLVIGNLSFGSTSGGVMMAVPGAMAMAGSNYIPSYMFAPMQGGEETRVFFYGYLNKELQISDKKFPNHGPIRLADKRIQALRKTIKLGSYGVMSSDENVFLVYINRQERSLNIEQFK